MHVAGSHHFTEAFWDERYRLREILETHVRAGSVPGAVALVGRAPMTPDSIFRNHLDQQTDHRGRSADAGTAA